MDAKKTQIPVFKEMTKPFKSNELLYKAVSLLGSLYLTIADKTSILKRFNVKKVADFKNSKKNAIFAVWHSQMLQTILAHKGMNIRAMVSQSKDGEYIARIIKKFSFVPVRGSTSRNAIRVLLKMIKYAKEGHSLAITPDGPKGPQKKVKPGIIYAAQKAQIPIIPIGAAISKKMTFGSWDEFECPLPFSKIFINYGAPIIINKGDDIEKKAAELTDTLNRLTREANKMIKRKK